MGKGGWRLLWITGWLRAWQERCLQQEAVLGSRSSGSMGQCQLGRGWSPRLRSGASALQASGKE